MSMLTFCTEALLDGLVFGNSEPILELFLKKITAMVTAAVLGGPTSQMWWFLDLDRLLLEIFSSTLKILNTCQG